MRREFLSFLGLAALGGLTMYYCSGCGQTETRPDAHSPIQSVLDQDVNKVYPFPDVIEDLRVWRPGDEGFEAAKVRNSFPASN